MDFAWPDEIEAFREQICAFLDAEWSPSLQAEIDAIAPYHPPEEPEHERPLCNALLARVAEKGWLQRSLSRDLGGGGESPWFEYVLSQELRFRGVPYNPGAVTMFAPALTRFGTEEQQRYYIPRLASGEITLALGYSEPGAGSDLAALATRAVRDGDEYVINGQKIWTSEAHLRTHVWLAVRTGQDAPKHRGISLFIVPLNSPGITIRPIWTMAGVRTNETFWEDVRVPQSALIGEENRGWYIIANALDSERILVGVGDYQETTYVFDRLREALAGHAPQKLQDPAVRRRLAQLRMEIEVQRAILLTNAALLAAGETPNKEASMAKVWGTELRHRLSDTAMDLLGRRGVLRKQSGDRAVARGRFEAAYRYTPVMRFAGGTNEIQRNIIAQRGLGLPR